MVIDVILDRRAFERDGNFTWYTEDKVGDLYEYATFFGFDNLASALDGGGEEDVKDALCEYIESQDYNPEIKDYIRSVRWLVGKYRN